MEVDSSDVLLAGGGLNVVGGLRGSCLTYTVASAGLENTSSPLLGILRELVVFQEFRVRTQSQNLRKEDKQQITTLLTLYDKTGCGTPQLIGDVRL